MHVTQAWYTTFPNAYAGTLLMQQVRNPPSEAALDRQLEPLAADLRRRFEGYDRARLAELPTIAAYQRHYRAFGQTYHVLRQVESVVLKGKPLASPGGVLVSAMFAAEIESHVLTAGHDADAVVEPLVVDCSQPGDQFVGIGGRDIAPRPGDMLMRDGVGIISAVLYGPDERTRLQPSTTRALFVAYAPAGVGRDVLQAHLERIAALVNVGIPAAEVAQLTIAP
jgi:DNA/RNA-binding domain of Phe-tRNA-synthetase-like protein